MAPHTVIDLISSSPSPPSAANPPNPAAPPKRTINGGSRQGNSTTAEINSDSRQGNSTTAEADTFSDFAFSDDGTTSLGRRKRQRRDSPTGPPLQLKPKSSTILQISSSLEEGRDDSNSRPHTGHDQETATLAKPRAPAARRFVPSLDSDPFTSSPPRTRAPDPFTSSPLRTRAPVDTALQRKQDTSGPPPPSLSAGQHDAPARKAPRAAHAFTRVMSLDTSRDAAKKPSKSFNTSLGKSFNTSSGKSSNTSPNNHNDVVHISDSELSNASSDDDLPDIFALGAFARQRPPSTLQRSRSENITSSRPLKRNISETSTAMRQVDKKARAVAKAAEQESKRREQEKKRREKELAKETRNREKNRAAALAEANKRRTDKKVSTPEMIVDLASSMALDHRAQAEVLLEELGVEFTTWDQTRRSAVKWRRKVTSRYNDDLDRWEPIEPRIHQETHVLIILSAENFVSLALKDELDAYAVETRQIFHGCSILYILQGMTAWIRKNRNLRNRQFTSRVRSVGQELDGGAPGASSTRRSNNTTAEYVCEELVEDALLRLQLEHDALIHDTVTTTETARWIATFTQHISTVPYKKQKDYATSAAGFCMESGQIRTGEDAKDTYIKMLQENARVTAPIAFGIATEFESVAQLVKGFDSGGPMRLDGVRKCANRDGQLSDRAIGQAMSRRLHKVFTGRDESSTDV